MGKVTFIIGGARSGKSAFALKIARRVKRVAFIATCEPKDCEMKKRVALHRSSRPLHWKTFEAPLKPLSVLKKIGSGFDCIIIECLTLLVSNMLAAGFQEVVIEKNIKETFALLKKIKASSVIVSNEAGLGIVPQNNLARQFRDIAGRINQLAAEKADRVFFVVSGLPLKIK